MPRGTRPRKPRLSRMDAAVDAMAQIGFPPAKVRSTVKELLKVYGGAEGWPFIEEYAYKELIDAILRDVEGNSDENFADDGNLLDENVADHGNILDENVGDHGNLLKIKSIEDEGDVGTSYRLPDNQQGERPQEKDSGDVEMPSGSIALPSKRDSKDGKDIPSPPLPPPPTIGVPTPRQYPPCYGWIESDEVDPDEPFDDGDVGNSLRLLDNQQDETPQEKDSADVEMLSCLVPETTTCSGISSLSEIHSVGGEIALPFEEDAKGMKDIPSPPLTSAQPSKRHRLPCYGWIESDEEDPDDLMELTPMPGRFSSEPW